MSDNPLSGQYWSAEEAALWEQLAPLVMGIMLRGADSGAAMLPPEAAILMNWDVFNEAAVRYLNQYRLAVVRGISETTRDKATRAIAEWIQSGEPLPVLQERLAPLFGKNRAEQIAITEVTRVYADGNMAAWQAAGIVNKRRWNTANDERVCPVCGPLHGVVVGMDEGFTPEGPGFGPMNPPLHPRCRCWLSPVVDLDAVGARFDEILRR